LISGIANNFCFSRFYDIVAAEDHDQASQEEKKNQSPKADDQKVSVEANECSLFGSF